jgi:hypothetical protein
MHHTSADRLYGAADRLRAKAPAVPDVSSPRTVAFGSSARSTRVWADSSVGAPLTPSSPSPRSRGRSHSVVSGIISSMTPCVVDASPLAAPSSGGGVSSGADTPLCGDAGPGNDSASVHAQLPLTPITDSKSGGDGNPVDDAAGRGVFPDTSSRPDGDTTGSPSSARSPGVGPSSAQSGLGSDMHSQSVATAERLNNLYAEGKKRLEIRRRSRPTYDDHELDGCTFKPVLCEKSMKMTA